MKCDLCPAKATVFFTNIIGGKMQKVALCEDCAKEKQVTEASGYDIADLLIGVGDEKKVPAVEDGAVCSECGFTHADFKRVGRLGCAHCYVTFEEELRGVLKAMHKGTRHRGKVPGRLLNALRYTQKMESLGKDLEKAVEEEHYEDAAQIRDELRRLEEILHETPASEGSSASDDSNPSSQS